MSLEDFVQSNIDQGNEVIASVTGTMTRSNGQTVITYGSAVVLLKGGKTLRLKGKRIVGEKGEWFVDGKKVEV